MLRPVLMRKYLIPVAAVLAWCIALTALSVFDSMDAERDAKVTAGRPGRAQETVRITGPCTPARSTAFFISATPALAGS